MKFDKYYMDLAKAVANRATCDRRAVGAVVVKQNTVIAMGFNSAPASAPTCDDVGHLLVDMGGRQSCVRTVHAEMAAIGHAALLGVSLAGATIYTTASPCYDCAKLIVNTGILRVVSGEFYASRYGLSDTVADFFKQIGLEAYTIGV